MAGNKKPSRQQCRKLFDGECFFCGEKDYDLLDCHRIYEGADGGTYHWLNSLTACSNCHRKCHSGRIQVHGRYLCTNGRYVVHYHEDGEEKWK